MPKNGKRFKHLLTLFLILYFLQESNLLISRRSRILSKSNPSRDEESPREVAQTQSQIIRKTGDLKVLSSFDTDSNETEGLEERFISSANANRVPITFKKCKTKIDQLFDVVKAHAQAVGQESKHKSKKHKKSPPREETLYMLKHKTGMPMNKKIFFGIKLRENVNLLKGAYVFYNKDLPNKSDLNIYLPLMPEYGGCKRKVSSSQKDHVKSLELLYEHLPFWVNFFEITQRQMTNLIMVEMVHQLFMFLLRLFATGMYVKNFDSRFIGVRVVSDIHSILGYSQQIYLNQDLAFVFKNIEAFEYHCHFKKESDFKHLERIFVEQKGREFRVKNESNMDICHQMNLYNLLKILEISLFKSSNIEREENDFFIGCLDEAEDQGKGCPTVILAVLGMDVNKVKYESTKNQKVHLNVLKQLRTNLLAYTTQSFKQWFGIFLKDLILTFRKKPVRVVPSLKLDKGRVEFLISKFKNSILKINQSREQSGNHDEFAEELRQISEGLDKLISIQLKINEKLNESPVELSFEDSRTANKQEIGKIDGFQDLSDIQESEMRSSQQKIVDGISQKSSSANQKSQSSEEELEEITQTLATNLKDVEEVDALQQKVAQDGKAQEQSALTSEMKYQFEEGEQMAFVQRVDNQGLEYISMEINLNMINPKDFGFEDYKEQDEEALNRVVQQYFLEQLKQDPSLQGIVMEIDQSYMLI